MPVDANVLGILGTDDFPRVSKLEPVVGAFDLMAIVEFLPEEPELVVDSVSDCGNIQRG